MDSTNGADTVGCDVIASGGAITSGLGFGTSLSGSVTDRFGDRANAASKRLSLAFWRCSSRSISWMVLNRSGFCGYSSSCGGMTTISSTVDIS